MNKAIEMLKACTVVGNEIILPDIQFDKDTYKELKKMLTGNHGKYSRGKFIFQFPAQDVVDLLMDDPKFSMKKNLQAFFTPEEAAIDLFNTNLPCSFYNIDILEPSAGQGALIEGYKSFAPGGEHLFDFCELNPIWRNELIEKGYNCVGSDFLKFSKTTDKRYDYIIANPPFAKKQDVIHILHMIPLLKEHGGLVSFASSMITEKKGKEYDLLRLALTNGSARKSQPGAFRKSGTNVDTVMIGVDRDMIEDEVIEQINDYVFS